MKNYNFSAMEKEMASFDFNALQTHATNAQKNILSATTADDVRKHVCDLWSKVGKYVKLAEMIPFVGKFISLLADAMDGLCQQQPQA